MRHLVSCLTGCLLVSSAHAQSYPAKPIRMIVPFAAGGGTDFVTRFFGQKLADAWGQQVVVDNRPGAAGILGSDIAAKATPDGYTLVMGSGSHNVNPSLYRKLPYDTERDFAPITLIALVPIVLSAHPAVQARDARELIALARSQPGRLAYASFGVGAISHLAGELLKTTGKVDIVHVPYKGAGDALGNLLGGQVQLMFSSPAAVVQQFKSGKLKGLAVTGSQRQKAAPEIPTFSEQGLAAVDISEWYGLLAPARTPAPVIAKVRGEIVRILNTPEVSERLAAVQFAEPVGSTPAQFADYISAEIPKLSKIIRDAGIRPE
jgi:tripartite-type tricarboxylate transporter receptor subunit TctC